MKEHNFDYIDISNFEKKTDINALHSGKPTKSFLKYLFDRYQMKITDFFQE